MGARSEEKILKALEAGVGEKAEERRLLGQALPAVRRVVDELAAHPAAIAVSEAGSVRRRRETVRDLDLIATSTDPPALIAAFCDGDWVAEVAARGDTKATVVGHDGLRFDLRVVPPECYGNVLQHFTGSKDHNIALREDAQRRGLSISEYGVTEVESGEVVTHASEDELYEFLGYAPIPPELREGTHEIGARAARASCRSSSSSGTCAARCTATRPGRRTARTRSRRWRSRPSPAGTASSASPTTRTTSATAGSRRSGRRSPSSTRGLKSFRVLRGIEVNIRADGSLDVDDDTLAELDWVIASLHTSFDRSPTERILGAMDNPHVDCIGHLTGRRLLKRDGAPVDVERVVAHAVETGTALEINSQPDRLDMRDTHARLAGEAGVRIPITTDAHSIGALGYAEFGVAQARRAWLTKEQVLNTRRWREIEKLREVSTFRDDGALALDWVASYLEGVRELPVLSQVEPGAIRAAPAVLAA